MNKEELIKLAMAYLMVILTMIFTIVPGFVLIWFSKTGKFTMQFRGCGFESGGSGNVPGIVFIIAGVLIIGLILYFNKASP